MTTLAVKTLQTFAERFWGVKHHEGKKLYFPHCRSVHTFGLKAPLQLLWLGQNGELIRQEEVPPNRVRSCGKAEGVVEIPLEQKLPDYPTGHQFKLQGQALVETAFVIPVLFLLLFGFIQLGLMLHAQQQLTYVTQNATQVGSLTNNDLKITGAIETYYEPTEVNIAVVSTDTVTNSEITNASRRYNDLVEVQLTQPYTLNVPFWDVPVFDLTAQASARVLCQSSTTPYQCD